MLAIGLLIGEIVALCLVSLYVRRGAAWLGGLVPLGAFLIFMLTDVGDTLGHLLAVLAYLTPLALCFGVFQGGAWDHETKKGLRDRRFKHNDYHHLFSEEVRASASAVGLASLLLGVLSLGAWHFWPVNAPQPPTPAAAPDSVTPDLSSTAPVDMHPAKQKRKHHRHKVEERPAEEE